MCVQFAMRNRYPLWKNRIKENPSWRTIATPDAPRPTHAAGLTSAQLLGLLVTQFLGAMNDNMFRLLAIGIGTEYVLANQSSAIVAAGLACFTLPYLLLAAPAGYLADRFSKRRVIVLCKVAEIVIMALAVAAILLAEPVPDLLGAGPDRRPQRTVRPLQDWGASPRCCRPDRISAANGLMGLVTVVATVAGVVAGNSSMN